MRSATQILENLPSPANFEPIIVQPTIESLWSKIHWPSFYDRLIPKTIKADQRTAKKQIVIGQVNDLKELIISTPIIKPKGMYQFFYAKSYKNEIHIFDQKSQKIACFSFPRQMESPHLCLSDYIHPDNFDSIAFFVVSGGIGVNDQIKPMIANGNYVQSHLIEQLALSAAEALASEVHNLIRSDWGLSDSPKRGQRFSLGYPACPELAQQRIIWELLLPDETIGVTLTSGDMMYPEASVSGLVFHHPGAKAFFI